MRNNKINLKFCGQIFFCFVHQHGGNANHLLKYGPFCFMLQLFAYAAQEHSAKYGSTQEQCAKIAYKNHKHSIHNPHASLRKEIPLKRICESRMICKPITLTMSAPTADGSAAAVVCSRDFMEFRGMQVSFKFAYMRRKKPDQERQKIPSSTYPLGIFVLS